MLLNCGVGEDSWESLGLQGDPTSPILKEISPEYSLEGLMLKLKLQLQTSTDVEAEILWPPDAKGWLIWKDPDAGKDWGQEEKGTTEDEMVGWHHWLNGYEFEQTLEIVKDTEAWYSAVHGVSKRQTRLSDWTELNAIYLLNINGWD